MGIRSRRRVKAWIGSAAADVTAPTVTASQSFDYPEQSSAGAVIGTVAATDNFAVTGFRFADTTTSTSLDTFYSINDAGVVTLTAAGETGANDFETATNPYTHPIQAKDAAGNWSASVDVDFNITDITEAGASMKVGVNTNFAVYTSGATPFANLMWNAQYWQDHDDAYNYWVDQDQHNVTNNTVPHVLVAGVASSEENLPAGTYTVRNPDGRSIGFGDNFGSPNITLSSTGTSGYTTATSFTFELSAGSALGIFTNSNGGNTAGTIAGAIQVILPGHVTSWDAGDWFNSAWVSYQQGLGTQAIRTMDWLGTNDNIFDSWSEQPTLTKTGIRGFGARYPLEVAIAAANKLNVPLWLNVTVRASDAWVSSAASLIDASYTLPYLYVEYANEVWNTGLPGFAAQTNWAKYLPFTKITATCSGTTFTKTSHGLSNGQEIRPWFDKSGRTAAGERYGLGTYWLQMGNPVYAKVLTADTFEIWDTAALTNERADAGTVATQILYVDPAEVGKTADMDVNYATRAKEIWDILDAALGASHVKAVIASQNGAALSVTARMSVTGVGARTDYVAPAPYFIGITMGGAVDRASTQFTPKLWSTAGQPAGDSATVDVAFRVYASGSTPRNDEVKAGTGTGYVGGSTFTQTYSGASYTSGSAVTGLTNGTNYLCYFCVTDEDGNDWFWSQTIQASASADTVDMLDTYENQKNRTLLDIDGEITNGSGTYVALTAVKDAAQAINASCELVCYEGGNHQSFSRPAAITTWWEAFIESAEHAEIVEHYLYTAAAAGCKLFMWYQDIGASGAWTLADSNYDTADLRYQAVAAFGGLVPQQTKVSVGTINAGDLTAAPGAFPYTQYTFADATLTYSIVSGDNEGNYQITGANFEVVATTNINFATSEVKTLMIRATDGETDDIFPLSINLGLAPLYESDARIAWDKFTDADTAQFNPSVGNALSENSGASTAATIDGSGWWDFNSVSAYGNVNAMTDTVPYTDPFGLLWVGKRDDQTVHENIILFSTTNWIGFTASFSSGSELIWEWWDGGATEVQDLVDWSDGNPLVAWQFFDGPNNLMYRGKNQTLLTGYGSGVAIPATKATLNKQVQLAATTVKHGAFELVSRSGMTLSDWLAIVQKYQDAFGIA